MKTLISVLLGFCVTAFAFAQPPGEIGLPKRTPEELEKLVAPIALYPDALIALILPASSNSSDIVLAARFLSSNPDAADLESQPWEESVKSLARYPEVVKWMDENLTWTRELGEAFAAQPADVMNTVQKLRSDARANGLLKDSPQQKVVVRDAEVCIVPAEENVIYVPVYDPDVLIMRRPYYDSWLTFSVGFATGSWLYYDCDWSSRSVWVYRRPHNWAYRPDWRWHDRDRERVVHEQWRPSPAYWHHREQSHSYGYRPVPRVEPPHFHSHNDGFDGDRRWDGRHDEHVFNPSHVPPTRPSGDRDRGWDLRQQSRENGIVTGSDTRIRRGNTFGQTPAGTLAPSTPGAIVTAPAPIVNAAPVTPISRPPPEHHRRPDGVAGERNFPREINNPASQRTDTPSAVRQQPPAAPSPERIGQMGPRAGQYTPRQSDRPINTYRREGSSQPAPSFAPPPVVQHSAPVTAPPPAAAAPAPVRAPVASAPAPVSDPGRDQRGGYHNRGGDDDGRNRR